MSGKTQRHIGRTDDEADLARRNSIAPSQSKMSNPATDMCRVIITEPSGDKGEKTCRETDNT